MDRTAHLLLRVGVAFAFLYPALNALGNPDSWIGYFPPFLLNSGIPSELLLHGFGALEVGIAVWLLMGRNLFWPAMAATVILVSIVLFNLAQFEILFRDLAIAAASLALAANAWRTRNKNPLMPSQQV
ncbi:MAG: hypothetical protein JWL87_124 [Candidatus Adlerbacteria bacterium]|nr:hypothetical protein [Candidatus Adlerbacteria bacterium]